MTVSVAMAACNGSKYIKQQIDSIMPQLGVGDQLIISVDPSTDDTLELLTKLASNNPQIQIIQGPGRGVTANFQSAISQTTGSYIFLSDHDDIWYPNKLAKVMECFTTSGASLILHDAEVVDQYLDTISLSFFAQRGSKPGYRHNIAKNSYMGCCMAFRSSLKPIILPFPNNIPMFDQWIGLLAEKNGSVAFLEEPLIKYRRHDANATAGTHASPAKMLKWRKDLIKELNKRLSVIAPH